MSTKPKRRVVHRFRIDEISGVDSPAQEGARMTLLKRKDDDEPDEPVGQVSDEFRKWMDQLRAESDELWAKRDAQAREEAERRFVLAAEALGKRTDAVLAKCNPTETETEKEPVMLNKTTDAFEKVVNDILERDECTYQEAMRKARKEDPAAYALFQHAPMFPRSPSLEQHRALAKVNEATAAFEKHINAIRVRDNCSRKEAMYKARVEYPVEFRAWQNS